MNLEEEEEDDDDPPDLDDDPSVGHGTGISALAVGQKYGVAKKANLVMVKVTAHADEDWSWAEMIAAVGVVLDDVKKKDLKGKAVLNMSLTLKTNMGSETEIGRLGDLLLELMNEWQVVIVAAAGNEGQVSHSALNVSISIDGTH